ncbi:MAG: maleylpyruvate isomerase N-terminal domain-containing protein [Chloroflexi bacterium]|nr:maleylpyruvate isomerase N-terminal domain-containing protein [Chloroflexota bacterium]
MSDRTYASWVEPIATSDRESRIELLELVRTLSPADWERASPLSGWTLKDVLAHLAGGTGKNFQQILEAVVSRTPVNPAMLGDADARNAQDVEDRKDMSVGELISEIVGEGDAIDLLLSKLTDGQKDLRQDNIPMSLGEGLSQDPGGHYREHLAHFKETLKGQD